MSALPAGSRFRGPDGREVSILPTGSVWRVKKPRLFRYFFVNCTLPVHGSGNPLDTFRVMAMQIGAAFQP